MTVRMVATIKRFVGLSVDIKPVDDQGVDGERVYDGSTFLEEDTGNLYGYAGGEWSLKTEGNIALRLENKLQLTELLAEAKKANEFLEAISSAAND